MDLVFSGIWIVEVFQGFLDRYVFQRFWIVGFFKVIRSIRFFWIVGWWFSDIDLVLLLGCWLVLVIGFGFGFSDRIVFVC
jgi:hypothetical protein